MPKFIPPFLGYPSLPSTGVAIGSSNMAVLIAVENPITCTVSGVWLNVSNQSGNIDVGLYDSLGNRTASSWSVSCPASSAKALVNFISSVTISAGIYHIAISSDNITATFGRFGLSATTAVNQFTSSFPLPSTLTMPGSVSTTPFSLTLKVVGGITQ